MKVIESNLMYSKISMVPDESQDTHDSKPSIGMVYTKKVMNTLYSSNDKELKILERILNNILDKKNKKLVMTEILLDHYVWIKEQDKLQQSMSVFDLVDKILKENHKTLNVNELVQLIIEKENKYCNNC